MNALFSEIYGCYYAIAARILTAAQKGTTAAETERIMEKYGFAETAFHLAPLIAGEWKLLEKRGELYYSRLDGPPVRRPATALEKAWLSSLLGDPRMRLFLSDERLGKLKNALAGVEPLFRPDDFVCTDRHLDGDDYGDDGYIARFRLIMNACRTAGALKIAYESEKHGRSERTYYPYKLCYSELNDKFRLLCAAFNSRTGKLDRITLNLARIKAAETADNPYEVTPAKLGALYAEQYANPPLTLEISTQRNALERFMLQFASFERRTRFDAERRLYVCELYYDLKDEAELLILILGFGPTVKVLGPDRFVAQIKERLAAQMRLFGVT